MRRHTAIASVVLAFSLCAKAQAADFSLQGYADFRIVTPAKEKSWLDGGLGKFRYGEEQPDPDFRFAEAVGQGTLSLRDDLHIVGVARVEPKDRAGLDALEFYTSYRPQIADWNINIKAGAFFPPFSLENTDVGWTSPYTLTPSAINSWFGHELRTIGSEVSLSRRTSLGTLSLTASIFCCNDPAGVLIASGGWSLDDRYSGLLETIPIPGTVPVARAPLFRELDNRAGWYGGAGWEIAGIGKLSVYRYDNDADPSAFRGTAFGWRTYFWSGGWESHFGALSLLAQGMNGTTVIAFPGGSSKTNFRSVYALAGYDIDEDWRVAARVETFTADSGEYSPTNEHGNALTFAASWMPHDWLRVTGEMIEIASRRAERTMFGVNPRQIGTQFQLSTRIIL